MSKVISYTRSFTVLPLTVALSALLLSACSNTTSVNKPVYKSPSQVVKQKSPNQRTTQPRPIVVDSNRAKATTVSNAPAIEDDSEDITAYLDEESLNELADLLEATDMTMVENNQLLISRYGDLWDRVRRGYGIKRPYNSRIEAQKKWFITRQDYLNRLTARSSRYLYHTVREAERRHIPTELALLPVIESSYDPTATSNAAAAGLWQFIPSTGRIYGLSQSSTYDGRRDVIESTRAAYDFLTTLYNQFGSWELALAAYNAGPGRIQRAIEYNEARGRPTDFWSLNLPTETMNYVPRFLAVADIVEQPRKYGVYFPAIANQQHFRSVPVNYGVSLTDISQLTGVSLDELQKLNPALIANRIDATGPQRVVIPNEVNNLVDKKISALTGYGDNSNIIAAAQKQYKPLPKPIVVQNTTNKATSSSNKNYGGVLPNSSDELAEFATAANASVPKQNTAYIPPLSAGNQPIVNTAQSQSINQEFGQSNNLPTTSARVTQNNTIIQEPPLTKKERDHIAEEIRRQGLNTTDVVSNVDGNIKLGAVQTQQSILESSGREKKLSFASSTNTYANSNQPKGKRSTYKVKRGDTLINIASRAGLNWREIAQWNQIDPSDTLLAGSVLYLYGAKPIGPLSSQQNTPSRPQSYVVQDGDTLIGTANRFGLSVSQLAKYNNLSTNANLIIGQQLWLVPGKASNSTSNQSQNTSSAMATKTYQVQKGDGLIALARQFGMSVESLAELNGLQTNQQLYIGQKLKVPASANTSVQATNDTRPSTSSSSSRGSAEYTVQSGDTLIGIANKLGLDAAQIAAVNDFNANSHLLRGQTIKLPVSQTKVDIRLNDEDVKYKVQSGDTLIGVANRYGVSVSALAAANGLSNNANLIRGRTITIPSGGTSSSSSASSTNSTQSSSNTSSSSSIKDTESYKVQSGDTLIGLAKQYGVAPSDLASLNNISSKAQLRRGQTLKVPKLTVSYTVRSGDTLIGLARKYGVSTKELADMNNISTNTQLRRGQRLTVPNR